MTQALYHSTLVEHAQAGRSRGRLTAPHLSATVDNPLCGDRVTIEWDTQCACGRKGAFIHDDVVRYSEIITGEDKLTCATTIDNTDSALKLLIDI